MKTVNLLFLATSLLFISFFNSSQESPELQEASKLTESLLKLFNENKFDEALPLAKRALQIREKLLPANDPRIETSLSYLGDVYIAKRDYKAARDVVARLLQLQEARFGLEDVNLASTLDRLAILHFRAGNWREAEAAYSRALALREKTFGSNSPQVAQTLYALEEFYRSKHDFDRAAANYRRPYLSEASVAAAWQARFTPTKLKARPVKVKGVIQYRFQRGR